MSQNIWPPNWKVTSHLGYYAHDIPLNPGGALIFEDERGKEYRLDLDAIRKGMQVFSEKYSQTRSQKTTTQTLVTHFSSAASLGR